MAYKSEDNVLDDEVSSVSHVVDAIVDGVLHGRYVPGQRLIAADLAEEFSVSRAPVREALHMLAGEGVVELTRNRGGRIRRLSVSERIDFLELTESMLVIGVRRATRKMDNPDYKALLEEHFQAIEGAWSRRHDGDFVRSLYEYHKRVNEIAGNQFLDFFYKRPYIRFYTSLLSEIVPGLHWDQYIFNYRQVHATILSGDESASTVTFESHIRWVLRNMRNDNPSLP